MANAATPSARPKGRLVNPEVLNVDPRLLEHVLAAPWQRAGAIVVDLVLIGLLSLLAGPVLGLLTGLTLVALGSRRVSEAKFWLAFRWVLIGLGAAVMILSVIFLALGRQLVRSAAFNLGTADETPALTSVYVPPSASSAELRRAITQLEQQVDTLKTENTNLRGAGADNPALQIANTLSKSLGLTFGWAGVYFTLFTSWFRGRTPGKLIFGSRVTRLDGRPLSAMDAFTRNGGYAAGLATGMVGFLRLLWDPNRQAIQDKIAGTVVVSLRHRLPPATTTSTPEEPTVKIPTPEAAAENEALENDASAPRT